MKTITVMNLINDDKYFIIGSTLKGGRYYSEDMSESEAKKMLGSYIDLVSYFGGGTIDLCRNCGDYYEVLYSDVIW